MPNAINPSQISMAARARVMKAAMFNDPMIDIDRQDDELDAACADTDWWQGFNFALRSRAEWDGDTQ